MPKMSAKIRERNSGPKTDCFLKLDKSVSQYVTEKGNKENERNPIARVAF